MSWVTGVILIFSLEELYESEEYEEYLDQGLELETAPVIDNIDAWLRENNQRCLENLSDHVGSNGKAMQAFVYGGAFNYFKVDEFIDLIRTQPWLARKSVRLLIKDEQEESFTLHVL